MLRTVARMWRVTNTSWGAGVAFNLQWVLYAGKMAMVIAAHSRNVRGSSNIVLYLEAVIYTPPLLYSSETELSSFHVFVKAGCSRLQWYSLFSFFKSQVFIWL